MEEIKAFQNEWAGGGGGLFLFMFNGAESLESRTQVVVCSVSLSL